jgi:PAS domain S-box-containing protein
MTRSGITRSWHENCFPPAGIPPRQRSNIVPAEITAGDEQVDNTKQDSVFTVSDPPNHAADAPLPAQPTSSQTSDVPHIRAEQIQLLIDGLRASLPASILVAAVMSYVQWPLIDHSVVVAWLCAVVLISVLRGALAVIYSKTRDRSGTDEGWLHAFTASTALAGAVWGLGAWMLYPPDAVAHQAFLGVLIAGLTAGAVTSLSACLSAAVSFVSLSLTPLAARFLLSDQEVIFALGLLTILFLAVTAIGARRMNASIVQNIRLRLQSSAQLAALRESEERARKLSMVAARTDNAVILTDGDGRVEWVNPGFSRITGYTLADVLGNQLGSLLQGPETDPRTVQRMREKLHRREGFFEQVLNYAKDARPYWVLIEVQPIKDEKGQTVHFMAIERDITESLQQQRELEQARLQAEMASKAKSDFLAMMSHEIRTPLNGVLGSLGLLRDTALDAQQRKYVETGRRSAEWLLSIINNILDFSKIEAGKFELELAVFNIFGLVESVVEMLEPRASEKAISIRAEVDAGVPRTAEGDAAKVRQILLNLAGNSVKFTSRGEVCIRVALLEQGENLIRLRFTVSDTGAGIPAERQGRVFEEFWTRSDDRSHRNVGTGLGLSISQRLVHILGGEIDFESHEGAGSRFWFDIPLKAVSPDPARSEQEPLDYDRNAVPWGKGIHLTGRILVAEDNPANQMIVQSLLERLGLTVDTVANGLEAVNAVNKRPYDLVLMDIGMPEMDGIAATRAIRALEAPVARVPIVAVTAHVMRGEREGLLTQGLSDYLSKPIDRTELLDCLTRWLTPEAAKMTESDQIESQSQPLETDTLIDRGILDQLLEDVGQENAELVVDAFVQELERQRIALEDAAGSSDLDAMAQAAHRLKSSAASFGATRLSQVVASIEKAARTGQTAAAVESMGDFRELARASQEAMDLLQREVFGSGA